MFFTTRVRYGVRALIEIGTNNGKEPLLLKDISKRQDISFKYLDHIFSDLKAKGIIKKTKTKKGGYILAKKPEEITLYEIIEAIEGNREIECLIDGTLCPRAKFCGARKVWKEVNQKVNEVLKNFTLKDFIKQHE